MRAAYRWLGLVVILAACAAAGAVGSAFMAASDRSWYAGLSKPSFNPPGWLFGPVWTVLYILMAVAAWLVYLKWPARGVKPALTAFAVQLVLNAIWTGLFFTLKSPLAGLADIIALWLAIGATMWLFRPISTGAFWLMVPYWLWVSFAMVLNGAIVRLN